MTSVPSDDRTRGERIAHLLASPTGVLIILPALIVAIGVVVLLLGRRATRDSAETMARHQLVAQAEEVGNDVTFALGQADPVLASLRLLAEPALATPDAVQRMRDVVIARPGIVNASIVFPVGVMWGSFIDRTTGELQVHETRVEDHSRTSYAVRDGQVQVVSTQTTQYEPRTRPQYTLAVQGKTRVWMPPRTFESSHKTGLTVTEPVYAADGTLTAVLTLDFDVGELSKFIGRPPIAGARTVMFTADGTVLAYPAAPIPEIARKEKRLLRYSDFGEPGINALFAMIGNSTPTEQRFMRIEASDGAYLASVAVIGGKRAGTARSDWYLATLVPERTLLGATRRFGRQSIIASAAALAIAFGVALMFAWNLVRMRRAVGAAREAARTAEQRAKELGSYRLVSRLGAGGMGEVWRAEHQLLARQAAIKLVRPDALLDVRHKELIQERFRREAQTLASLRSRHTIELYDYGVTADGAFFFVMELLDGLDLSQLVRSHGPQPAARVIDIIGQACQSLAEAHDAGLLHRDIKPANLFVCRFAGEVDVIKLLDFGIVHNVNDPVEAPLTDTPSGGPAVTGERLTREGVVIGTVGYIPPEAAVGAPLDIRGDLYALGCVAWWLLVGAEVFPRKSEEEVLHAHVAEPVPSLRELVRGWLPVELETLILSCLSKQPEDRPADARALADALLAIEIPAEHRWSRAQATTWWQSLRAAPTSAPDAATAPAGVAVQAPADAATLVGDVSGDLVLVPQRAGAAPSSEAMTIEARPVGRS